jgi:hypothetical protein
MANTLEILAKSGIIRISPQLWEKIHPHVPKVSQEFVEFMAAGAVRDVARKVSDRKLSASLLELSKEMAGAATGSLVASWEDGDICPPWPFPWPWPGPWPWELENPDPIPWRVAGIEQLVLANVLVSLSEVTTNVQFHNALMSSAVGIAKSIGSLVDDIEKCGTKPRPKGPGPKKS